MSRGTITGIIILVWFALVLIVLLGSALARFLMTVV